MNDAMPKTDERVTGSDAPSMETKPHTDSTNRTTADIVSTFKSALLVRGFCVGVWVSLLVAGLLLYMAMAICVEQVIAVAMMSAIGIYSAVSTTANIIETRMTPNDQAHRRLPDGDGGAQKGASNVQ